MEKINYTKLAKAIIGQEGTLEMLEKFNPNDLSIKELGQLRVGGFYIDKVIMEFEYIKTVKNYDAMGEKVDINDDNSFKEFEAYREGLLKDFWENFDIGEFVQALRKRSQWVIGGKIGENKIVIYSVEVL